MPSRNRAIKDSPSVRGTFASRATTTQSVLEPVVPQWVISVPREKIPPSEKRRLAKARKAKREQRLRRRWAKGLEAGTADDSYTMAVPLPSQAYGPSFERRLLRKAVGLVVDVADALGDAALVVGISIGDGLYDRPERDRPRIVQECAALLARDAKRDGLPPLVLTVYGYGARGLHAHLVAIVKPFRVSSYRQSETFRPYIQGNPAEAIKRATPYHLSIYLPKNLEEPGPITGGRLRLSRNLKRRLVGSGLVQPFSTPQLGFEPAAIEQPKPAAAAPSPIWRFDEKGQGVMFDDLPPARLAGLKLRVVRTELGLKQARFGAALGVSQSAVAHAECNDNSLSGRTTRRLLSLAHNELGRARLDAILKGGVAA